MAAVIRGRTLVLAGALAWTAPALAQKTAAPAATDEPRKEMKLRRTLDGYVITPVPTTGIPSAPGIPAAPLGTLYRAGIKPTDFEIPIGGEGLSFMVRGNTDEAGLGATFEPADEALREQLEIPAGQGLVVVSSEPEGAASRAGLKTNDILLMIADKPLGKPDDLPRQLRAAGEGTVTLKVLRAGKPVKLAVRPQYQVTFGPVPSAARRYVIGVQLQPIEEALRAQLVGLADGTGVLVSHVEPGSPADRAGLKKHDILAKVDGKPLRGADDLVAQVQDSDGKSITVQRVRRGEGELVRIIPELQKAPSASPDDVAPKRSYLTIRPRPDAGLHWTMTGRDMAPQLPLAGQAPQLGEILRELRELRGEVEQLRKALDRKDRDNADRPGR